jgi:uncharacterized damage-inducible protein DinB
MHTAALAREIFTNIREFTFEVLDALPHEALTWQPTHGANTIAWLVWHLTRVQDDHVAHLADESQAWDDDAGWALRFGVDPADRRIGYGDTADQIVQIAPTDPTVLTDYLDAVTDRTLAYLDAVDDEAHWDRIVDERWDPPVTARVRLASVLQDDLQHVGQAAYVRGLYERR